MAVASPPDSPTNQYRPYNPPAEAGRSLLTRLIVPLVLLLSLFCFLFLSFHLSATIAFLLHVTVISADVVIDLLLILLASACSAWPAKPVFSRELFTKLAKSTSTGPSGRFLSAQSEPLSVYSGEDTSGTSELSVIITVTSPTFTFADETLLIRCIAAALAVFDPQDIMIVDWGNAKRIVRQVHEGIKYLKVCPDVSGERGTQTSSNLSRSLIEAAQSLTTRFVLVIDSAVLLPSDLHLPVEQLHMEISHSKVDRVTGVTFALTTHSGFFSPGIWTRLADLQSRLQTVKQSLQSFLSGSVLDTSGSRASLWDRLGLIKSLKYSSYPTILSPRNNVLISAQTPVPVYNHLQVELKDRDFVPRRPLMIFFSVTEALCLACDWLKFIAVGLAIAYSPWLTSFGIGLWGLVVYARLFVLNLVYLRLRPDLKTGLFEALLFPLYLLIGSVKSNAEMTGLALGQ